MGEALREKWSAETGELYITDLIKIAVFLSLTVTLIYLPQPFVHYAQLSYFCESIVKSVELSGCVNEGTMQLIEELEEVYGIEPAVQFGGPFVETGGERRIQMQQHFTVTLTDVVDVEIFSPAFGSPLVLTVPLSKQLSGMSLRHWRSDEI